MKAAKTDMRKARKSATGTGTKGAFSDEERLAMRERAEELMRKARRGARAGSQDEEADVLAKIAAMPQPDRAKAERIHAIIKTNAPSLSPRLWYGMPAYASDGKIICYFQDAQKFKSRYATLGFSDKAKLDEGNMWPIAFALKELGAGEEARIVALLKQAVGGT